MASPQPRLKSAGTFFYVYTTTPRNLEELKGDIARDIENIDRRSLTKACLFEFNEAMSDL